MAGLYNRVIVWDAHTGTELFSFEGHGGDLTRSWEGCVVWSPDGEGVATAGMDSTAMVWDARPYFTVPGYSADGYFGRGSVSWSPAGDRFLTGHSDGWVKIWDTL